MTEKQLIYKLDLVVFNLVRIKALITKTPLGQIVSLLVLGVLGLSAMAIGLNLQNISTQTQSLAASGCENAGGQCLNYQQCQAKEGKVTNRYRCLSGGFFNSRQKLYCCLLPKPFPKPSATPTPPPPTPTPSPSSCESYRVCEDCVADDNCIYVFSAVPGRYEGCVADTTPMPPGTLRECVSYQGGRSCNDCRRFFCTNATPSPTPPPQSPTPSPTPSPPPTPTPPPVASADLYATLSYIPETPIVGSQVVYTATFTNGGPDNIETTMEKTITMLIQLQSSNNNFVSVTDDWGLDCSRDTAFPTAVWIKCYAKRLAAGSSLSATLTVVPTAPNLDYAYIAAARIEPFPSAANDPNLSNNTASERIFVQPAL